MTGFPVSSTSQVKTSRQGAFTKASFTVFGGASCFGGSAFGAGAESTGITTTLKRATDRRMDNTFGWKQEVCISGLRNITLGREGPLGKETWVVEPSPSPFLRSSR